MALAIHSAAPRIEANYNFYDEQQEPLMGVLYKPQCRSWLLFNQKQTCRQEGVESMVNGWERYQGDRTKLPFERVLELAPDLPTAVLFADIESKDFQFFHDILSRSARAGKISYRVRYRAPVGESKDRKMWLSGYGVELALKKTDYLVMDDRTTSSGEKVDSQKVLDTEEEISDLAPLGPQDIAFLGTKSSSFIMQSEDKLDTLLRVVQDFPKLSAKLAAGTIDEQFAEEFNANRDVFLTAGMNQVWINGLPVEQNQMNAFALLETLRKERRIMETLQELGLSSSEALRLLNHKMISASKKAEQPQRYDFRDTTEGGKVVIWLNDIEKDERYQDMTPSLKAVLLRSVAGGLPQVRANLIQVVLPVDLSKPGDAMLVTRHLLQLVQRGVTIRFGFVPLAKSDDAIAQAKIVHYLVDNVGLIAGLSYIENSLQNDVMAKPNKKMFDSSLKAVEVPQDKVLLSMDEVLASVELEEYIKATNKWAARLGAKSNPPPVFVNGLSFPMGQDWMQHLSGMVQMEIQTLQGAVYMNELASDGNAEEYLLQGAQSRRNGHIVPEDEATINVIDTTDLTKQHAEVFKHIPKVSTLGKDKLNQAEIWVVGDFDEKDGYELLQAVAETQTSVSGVDVRIINNPELVAKNPSLSTLLYHMNQHGFFRTSMHVLQLLKEVTPTSKHEDFPSIDLLSNYQKVAQPDVKSESWYFNEHVEAGKFWQKTQEILKATGLKPGQRGLVVNGRVIGPIPRDEEFAAEDVKMLLDYERAKRITPVMKAAEEMGVLDKVVDPVALTNFVTLTSQPDDAQDVFGAPPSIRLDDFEKWKCEHSCITVGDKDGAIYNIVAAVDPASESAQKIVPILKTLSHMHGVYLRIFLNPQRVMNELPVKRFYRYVINAGPMFDQAGYDYSFTFK